MKKLILTLFTLLMLFGFWIPNYAQQGNVNNTTNSNRKKRLLILPAKIDTTNTNSIENETTNQIVKAAINLRRFEIIDWWNIMGLTSLQQDSVFIDSMVVKFAKNISASEVLIVRVLNFHQQGIPPDLEDPGKQIALGLVVELFNDEDEDEEEEEKYASNVKTELHIQVEKLGLITGKRIRFFNVYATHTGGNREKSKAKVMKKVNKEAMKRLTKLFH